MTPSMMQTLPGTDYHDPAVYELERQRIFLRRWFMAGRAEQAPEPGGWFTVDVVGESVLIVRGDDMQLRAFYNVCRHRGSRLRTEESGLERGTIMCPYHAWCYDLRGELAVTPRVGDDELDRSQLSLWPVHLEVWQGFVLVNLSKERPQSFREQLLERNDHILEFERFDMETLRIGATSRWLVEANWKIILENYGECLHCPTVHPELVELIPAYRTGSVWEPGRSDGGVWLAEGNSYAPGVTTLPTLPAMTDVDAKSAYGGTVFPNAMIDASGTSIAFTQLIPKGPARTLEIAWYLFHPDTIDQPDFDPSVLVEFNDLVYMQDNTVCERAQLGVQSQAYTHGVYPEKDELLYRFNQRYLNERDGVPQ